MLRGGIFIWTIWRGVKVIFVSGAKHRYGRWMIALCGCVDKFHSFFWGGRGVLGFFSFYLFYFLTFFWLFGELFFWYSFFSKGFSFYLNLV